MGDKYEWMTLTDVDIAIKQIAAGFVKMDLIPEMEAEGTTWRFMGVQSKNRKEWYLTHLANMLIKTTTVALYDTLGEEAQKFVCEQTELATVCCSSDIVMKIAKLKESEPDG